MLKEVKGYEPSSGRGKANRVWPQCELGTWYEIDTDAAGYACVTNAQVAAHTWAKRRGLTVQTERLEGALLMVCFTEKGKTK